MSLTKKKCIPCEDKNVQPLDYAEASRLLREIPGWNLAESGHHITRDYSFKDFVTALDFVNKVGEIAESEGHHPDISIFYNTVQLVLYTHSISGLSENDFILAAKIDMMIQEKHIPLLF
jgi:4a-hydroxytetrahydrobiopterin dehydratase